MDIEKRLFLESEAALFSFLELALSPLEFLSVVPNLIMGPFLRIFILFAVFNSIFAIETSEKPEKTKPAKGE